MGKGIAAVHQIANRNSGEMQPCSPSVTAFVQAVTHTHFFPNPKPQLVTPDIKALTLNDNGCRQE